MHINKCFHKIKWNKIRCWVKTDRQRHSMGRFTMPIVKHIIFITSSLSFCLSLSWFGHFLCTIFVNIRGAGSTNRRHIKQIACIECVTEPRINPVCKSLLLNSEHSGEKGIFPHIAPEKSEKRMEGAKRQRVKPNSNIYKQVRIYVVASNECVRNWFVSSAIDAIKTFSRIWSNE